MADTNNVSNLSKKLVDRVVSYYVESPEFNGIPLDELAHHLGISVDEAKEVVEPLVATENLSVASTRWQAHPHVKMIDVGVQHQIDALRSDEGDAICIYPEREAVAARVDIDEFDDRPFTKFLMGGGPQLEALGFELEVLEPYLNNPQYQSRFYDFGGRLSVSNEHSTGAPNGPHFDIRYGIGYGDDNRRLVMAFPWDLHNLPPDHQRVWKEHMAKGRWTVDEDYFRTAIQAMPSQHVSYYEAVIYEQKYINDLLEHMGEPRLFRDVYVDDRPRGFSFFVRPTRVAYLDFVDLLDKMLSENLDYKLFKALDRFEQRPIDEGVVEQVPKGSMQLLGEWLKDRFPDQSKEIIDGLLGPLWEVRKIRQEPAHRIVEDDFNPAYYEEQDRIIRDVHGALVGLRELLQTAPEAEGFDRPTYLDEFTMKSY